MSEPVPEYGEFRTYSSIANQNTRNFGNTEYISRGLSVFFFFHFYSELIMTASAKGIEGSLLTNPREFFYLCAERKIEGEMRLEAADRP
jgi:hypothetical protein